MKKVLMGCGIGCGGLMGLCIIIGIIAAVFGGGSSSSTDDTNETASVTTSSSDTSTSSANEITFTSQVVCDTDECYMEVTGINPNSIWGYEVSVTLENKSDDVTYMFSVSDATVNGVVCDPFWAEEVAPGKKANDSMTFTLSSLEELGLTDVTDIQLFVRVYDSNDWSAAYAFEDTVHVYPYGEDAATTFVREEQSTDNVIVDTDEVKITILSCGEDDYGDYDVNVYIENKLDEEITVSVDEASVNGYMEDPFWAKSVPAGCSAVSSIEWYDTSLEEDGITVDSIEEIEFKIYAYDHTSYSNFMEETITVNP